jgi:hypothetical protein
MKLIMRTEFDNLRLNKLYEYDVDENSGKQTIKIYAKDKLIAKKISQKKTVRYFGINEYKDYLKEED